MIELPSTKRGVYHNLKESKYAISNGEVAFFFSSMFYLNKFLDGYQTHRKQFNERIEKTMKDAPYNMDTLADLTFYKDTEKRGFHVRIKGQNTWTETKEKFFYQYVLRKMNHLNSLNWVSVCTDEIRFK